MTVTGKLAATSLVRRIAAGVLRVAEPARRSAVAASMAARQTHAASTAADGVSALGNMPPTVASGSASAAESNSRREEGASIELSLALPRYRHFMQYPIQH